MPIFVCMYMDISNSLSLCLMRLCVFVCVYRSIRFDVVQYLQDFN